MTTDTAPASKSAAVRRAGIELQAIPGDIARARECLDNGLPIKAAEWITAANRRANAVLDLLHAIFTATANERRAAAIEFRAESMRLGQERIDAIAASEAEAVAPVETDEPAAAPTVSELGEILTANGWTPGTTDLVARYVTFHSPRQPFHVTIRYERDHTFVSSVVLTRYSTRYDAVLLRDGADMFRPVVTLWAEADELDTFAYTDRSGVDRVRAAAAALVEIADEPVTSADEHRAAALEHDRKSAESFDRCDTDGALTQWGHDMLAQEHRLAAEIAEQGGTWTFPALFDLDGKLVAAKSVKTQFGYSWALLASDDPDSEYVGWFNESQARSAAARNRNNARKGYTVGRVKAPARAELKGGNIMSVTAVPVRLDGGFSRDVEIVSTVDTDD